MGDTLSRTAWLLLHSIAPGLMFGLGVAIITRRRWIRAGPRWIGGLLPILLIASPIVTLGIYIVMGTVMTGLFPGRDVDGSLFYSERIIWLALSVWFVPILILLAAAVVALRSWATDGHWLRWMVPIAVVVLVLRFSPSVVETVNQRYGFGIAHRLHFCGTIDGARVLAHDLRMARDLTLEGLSGPHGIPPLQPSACRRLQLLPAIRPAVVP